jgi:hypothetical protein
MFGKLEAVGTKGVGDDQLRARLDVGPVDLSYGGRLSKIELIEASFKPDAAGVEHGSHRAIREDRFHGKSFL